MNKKEWLDALHYNHDNQRGNLELAYAYLDNEGNPHYSKWKKFLECDDAFIQKANNRSILPFEVVLDIEDPAKYSEILAKVKEEFNYYLAYKTGSRGYHIHLWFDEDLTSDDKKIIIQKYDCDLQKATQRCMIALEYSPHWKTGNPKTFIEGVEGTNAKTSLNLIAKKESKSNNPMTKQDFFHNYHLTMVNLFLDKFPHYYDRSKILSNQR